MTLNRYAKKRDIDERTIVQVLRAHGAHVAMLDTPVDLLVGYQGRTILMEVKTGKAKLTPLQEQFFGDWKGGELVTVRSTEQALAVLGVKDRGVEIGQRVSVESAEGE